MNFKLSKLADQQLGNVFEYGEMHYGLNQAQAYAALLKTGLELLTLHPEIGMTLERKGYRHLRRLRWDSHVLIYDSTQVPILIIGILHKRADLYRHINKRIFE